MEQVGFLILSKVVEVFQVHVNYFKKLRRESERFLLDEILGNVLLPAASV